MAAARLPALRHSAPVDPGTEEASNGDVGDGGADRQPAAPGRPMRPARRFWQAADDLGCGRSSGRTLVLFQHRRLVWLGTGPLPSKR